MGTPCHRRVSELERPQHVSTAGAVSLTVAAGELGQPPDSNQIEKVNRPSKPRVNIPLHKISRPNSMLKCGEAHWNSTIATFARVMAFT
jgi:hypothetical protein